MIILSYELFLQKKVRKEHTTDDGWIARTGLGRCVYVYTCIYLISASYEATCQ